MKLVIPLVSIAMAGLFICCANDGSKETSKEKERDKLPGHEEQELINCSCSNGTGSGKSARPIFNYRFSNRMPVSVCGDKVNGTITELNVLNCSTGEALVRHDATQRCRVDFNDDTLTIFELKNLPVNNRWELELVPISKEVIVVYDNGLKSLGQKPFFINPCIGAEQQEEFLDDIELNKNNGLQQNWSWEKILTKLETLGLMGNQRAIKMLYNIEALTHFKFEGAVQLQYKQAIKNVERMKER